MNTVYLFRLPELFIKISINYKYFHGFHRHDTKKAILFTHYLYLTVPPLAFPLILPPAD